MDLVMQTEAENIGIKTLLREVDGTSNVSVLKA
jgi:hypothetical protein